MENSKQYLRSKAHTNSVITAWGITARSAPSVLCLSSSLGDCINADLSYRTGVSGRAIPGWMVPGIFVNTEV